MNRPMTIEEKQKYDSLIRQSEQLQMDIEALESKPVVYGYARVSSKGQARDGNSIEAQTDALKFAGAVEVYTDVYTGTTTERPELERLLMELRPGDTLVVTKLDRIARSVQQGISLIDELVQRGIRINVLNMGLMDNSPTGKLIRNVMLSFAEFERDMIMQRTREGKEVAKTKAGYREGRPKKFTRMQLDHAMDLLAAGNSYSQVEKMTGISKPTLARERRTRKIT